MTVLATYLGITRESPEVKVWTLLIENSGPSSSMPMRVLSWSSMR